MTDITSTKDDDWGDDMPPGWDANSFIHGGAAQVYVDRPDRGDDDGMTVSQAIALGSDLIRSAIYVADIEELTMIHLLVQSLAAFADDCAVAMHHCPRCGDGPYPEQSRPVSQSHCPPSATDSDEPA